MTNTALLKAKIILNNDTVQGLAAHLGKNRQNLSKKINGKQEFKQSEIAKIAERYNLSFEELKAIFLTDYSFGEELMM